MNQLSGKKDLSYEKPRALVIGHRRPATGFCWTPGSGDVESCAETGHQAHDLCSTGHGAITDCEDAGIGAAYCILQGITIVELVVPRGASID